MKLTSEFIYKSASLWNTKLSMKALLLEFKQKCSLSFKLKLESALAWQSKLSKVYASKHFEILANICRPWLIFEKKLESTSWCLLWNLETFMNLSCTETFHWKASQPETRTIVNLQSYIFLFTQSSSSNFLVQSCNFSLPLCLCFSCLGSCLERSIINPTLHTEFAADDRSQVSQPRSHFNLFTICIEAEAFIELTTSTCLHLITFTF